MFTALVEIASVGHQAPGSEVQGYGGINETQITQSVWLSG